MNSEPTKKEEELDPELREWFEQVIMKNEYYDIEEVDFDDLPDSKGRAD